MKNIFKFILIFCFFVSKSNGQQITIKRIESRLITNEGVEFIGNIKDKNNDLYSYSNWNNNGILFLQNKIYTLSNINFNITSNTFDSRITRDKFFSFKTSEIDSVSINNLKFKNIGNSFYEVLYETENKLFLKKYDIKYQEGIDNRLGGRTLGKRKAQVSNNYLVKLGETFKKVELDKSSILDLIDNENDKMQLINFVKEKNLSYKRVNDVIKIFKYIFKNSNKII